MPLYGCRPVCREFVLFPHKKEEIFRGMFRYWFCPPYDQSGKQGLVYRNNHAERYCRGCLFPAVVYGIPCIEFKAFKERREFS